VNAPLEASVELTDGLLLCIGAYQVPACIRRCCLAREVGSGGAAPNTAMRTGTSPAASGGGVAGSNLREGLVGRLNLTVKVPLSCGCQRFETSHSPTEISTTYWTASSSCRAQRLQMRAGNRGEISAMQQPTYILCALYFHVVMGSMMGSRTLSSKKKARLERRVGARDFQPGLLSIWTKSVPNGRSGLLCYAQWYTTLYPI